MMERDNERIRRKGEFVMRQMGMLEKECLDLF